MKKSVKFSPAVQKPAARMVVEALGLQSLLSSSKAVDGRTP